MKSRLIYIIIIILASLASCQPAQEQDGTKTSQQMDATASISGIDLPEVQERGTLKALLNYSSTSYFIYRGQPMGFEYDLLKRLAQHLNVDLEVIVAHDMEEVIQMLHRGEGDIIAQGLTITKNRREQLAFTSAIHTTRQVLVQRKPDNWRQMPRHKLDKQLVRKTTELGQKEIYVQKSSAYYTRLQNLSEEIGQDIVIKEVPGNLQTEDLIRLVAEGKIPYTVADENIAEVQKTYYQNIDIATPVSLNQNIAWAVRKSSPILKAETSDWLEQIKHRATFNTLYAKYFRSPKSYRQRAESEFFSKTTAKISEYDHLLKRYARRISWDWRMLASIVYEESRFDANARSWAGAQGLMQVMPVTGNHFGISNLYDPESNVRAGVAYLSYLKKYWSNIADSTQRTKFILASYNAGHGHVSDARKLAKKLGKNPNQWDYNVEKVILQLSDPKYYNDEVVRHGYVRGRETYTYVRHISDRYEDYQNVLNGNWKDNLPERSAWLEEMD